VDVPDLRAETIDELLDSDELDADGDAGRALELRRRVSFAATKKLDAFEAYAGPHDNKVRGILMFYGAIRTGRWSSSGPQVQNAKKPKKALEKLTDAIYADIKRGASADELGLVYGNPIESVASCIRHFVDDGKPMLNADYSAIEARVLAWLAGEQWRLDVFAGHGKIYEASIAQMLGIPLESVTKDLRQRGKVSELACIAEGELVLTDIGLVPIQNVTTEMRVWDGKTFVRHQGLAYRGVRQVITYRLDRRRHDDPWTSRRQRITSPTIRGR
jgi:DNA polymerase